MSDDYPGGIYSSVGSDYFHRGTTSVVEPALKSCSYCGRLGRPDKNCDGCGAGPTTAPPPKRKWFGR